MTFIAVRFQQCAVFLQFLVIMWEVDLSSRTFAESVRWSICIMCVYVCERVLGDKGQDWLKKLKWEQNVMTSRGIVALALHLNKPDDIRRVDEPIRGDCLVSDELWCALSIGNGSVMSVIEGAWPFQGLCSSMSASVDCTRGVDGFLWHRVTGGMRPGSTVLNPNSNGCRLTGTARLAFDK
jgi:hypothetical protein